MRGRILSTTKNTGKKGFGLILPDTALPGWDAPVKFFEDDVVEGVSFGELAKETPVQFDVVDRQGPAGLEPRAVRVSLMTVPPPPLLSLTQAKEAVLAALAATFGTSDDADFDDAVHFTLRLLGIHSLYQYDKRNQAGRADGLFLLGNLVVMYDSTLRENYYEHKKDQIENYVGKLSKSQITLDLRTADGGSRKKTLQIAGKSNHVWIVTRGKSLELSDYGGVKVKEVAVQDLLRVLRVKLMSDTFEEEDLASDLARIEKFASR